jgi:hypothetical protein
MPVFATFYSDWYTDARQSSSGEKSVKTDCEKLKESSQYVRGWISRQPSVKEESITDWLLDDISRKIKKITYKPFTRHEEAHETGADWEWWFIFDDYAYKLRVQAKKLNKNGNYASINKTNKYGLQINKLLKDARKKNFLPFYAFYTCEVGNVMCKRNINDEGVFMAGASRINNDFILPDRKVIKSSAILRRTVALSCMLCCPYCQQLEHGFPYFLFKYYWSEFEYGLEVDAQRPLLGYYREIPPYVSSLLQYRQGELPGWWEGEYRHEVDDIDALLVYDARHRRNY